MIAGIGAGLLIILFALPSKPDPIASQVNLIVSLSSGRPPPGPVSPADIAQIASLGPSVVPILIEKCRAESSRLDQFYRAIYRRTPMWLAQRMHRPTDLEGERTASLYALSQLGAAGVRPAAPEFLAGLHSSNSWQRAFAAESIVWLLADCPGAVEALTTHLRQRPGSLSVGYHFTPLIWPKLGHLTPDLSQQLHDQQSSYQAAINLASIGTNARAAVPTLVKVLAQTNPPPSWTPRTNFSAIPINTTPDSQWNLNRAQVAKALGTIEDSTPEVISALAKAWNDPEPSIRQSAAEAAARLGAPMASATAQLVSGLHETEPKVLMAKVDALGRIGPGARPALLNLYDLTLTNTLANRFTEMKSRSLADLSIAATIAMCRIDENQLPGQLPFLTQHLGLGSRDLREFLAHSRSHTSEVIRVAKRCLADPDRQYEAAWILVHHAPQDQAALAILRNGLMQTNGQGRLAAAISLYEATGRPDEVLQILKEGLISPQLTQYVVPSIAGEDRTSQYAMILADKMGRAALPVLPEIKAALWHLDLGTRRMAGAWLMKYAPSELPTLPTSN